MIGILGTGAFGTALAVSLCASHPRVLLWGRNADLAADIQVSRVNRRRLPDIPLPDNLTITAELDTVLAAETLLLAVPMQQLSTVLQSIAPRLAGKSLVACC